MTLARDDRFKRSGVSTGKPQRDLRQQLIRLELSLAAPSTEVETVKWARVYLPFLLTTAHLPRGCLRRPVEAQNVQVKRNGFSTAERAEISSGPMFQDIPVFFSFTAGIYLSLQSLHFVHPSPIHVDPLTSRP